MHDLLPMFDQPPRERSDAARNREALLAAAARLVEDQGVDAVTMDSVAAEAGVGKGTVFRRFDSREGLMAALLNRSETEWQRLVIEGPPPLGPGAPAIERLHAFGHSRMQVNLQHAELIRAAGRAAERSYAAVSFAAMHVRYLLHELGVRGDVFFLATALLSPLEMVVLVQQTRIEEVPIARVQAGWDDLVRRVVCSEVNAAVAHQPGGRRSCHGAAASTWADSASNSSSSAGRAASITPTGRPSGVQCSGSETAGMPVTFQAEVHGVKAFCASKSAAGSSSLRIAPTGSGGLARVGVSTASYGASAVSAPAATRRSSPIASPNSGPDTARPRSESHRVSGRSSGSASGRDHRERGQHRPAGLEDGDGVRSQRRGHVLDLVAEGGEQRGGVLVGPEALGIDVGVGDEWCAEPGDPEPSRVAVAGRQERRGRGWCPGRIPHPTTGEHVEHRRRVADVPGDRPRRPQTHRVAVHGVTADPPARGLEPDEAAARGRDPDRPATVRALGDGHQSGGHRRRRSAGRAARHPGAVPRGDRRRQPLGLGVAG